MAYLKDVKCENCGYEKIRINSFYDKDIKKTLVDGASCQVCFKNVVLPDEEYIPFIQKHGTR